MTHKEKTEGLNDLEATWKKLPMLWKQKINASKHHLKC